MTLKVAPGPPGPWRCVASLVAGRVATTLGDGLSLLVGREVSYGRDALPTPPRLRRAAHRRWLPIPDHLLPPHRAPPLPDAQEVLQALWVTYDSLHLEAPRVRRVMGDQLLGRDLCWRRSEGHLSTDSGRVIKVPVVSQPGNPRGEPRAWWILRRAQPIALCSRLIHRFLFFHSLRAFRRNGLLHTLTLGQALMPAGLSVEEAH